MDLDGVGAEDFNEIEILRVMTDRNVVGATNEHPPLVLVAVVRG